MDEAVSRLTAQPHAGLPRGFYSIGAGGQSALVRIRGDQLGLTREEVSS